MINRSEELQSKLFEEDRKILLFGEINNEMSRTVVLKLLLLEYLDPKAPITLLINTSGGSVTDGYAMIDVMNGISCPVETVALGRVASMGVPILASGTHGKRKAYKHAKIMIHQPSLSNMHGKSSDVDIIATDLAKTRQQLNYDLSKMTKQSIKKIENDTKDDFYMSSEEALAYGIIDEIC